MYFLMYSSLFLINNKDCEKKTIYAKNITPKYIKKSFSNDLKKYYSQKFNSKPTYNIFLLIFPLNYKLTHFSSNVNRKYLNRNINLFSEFVFQ